MIMQSVLSLTVALAEDRGTLPDTAIEMSESARPAISGHEVPAPEAKASPAKQSAAAPLLAGGPAPDAVDAAAADAAEAVEAADDAEAADLAAAPATAPAATAPAAVTPAAVTPAGAPDAAPPAVPEPVSWWREAASFLGLAPDPHPGETAEPAPGRPQLSQEYIIGPGDLLGISVWRDENLTRSVVVLPDGKIAFPLVGDLVAGGKTLAQLKAELERKLTRYITDAGLTVEVKQSNSMIFYIIGRVNAPGRQMMVATTNVLQGLAMAGGLNQYARRGEVKVFRKQDGKTSVFSFNYDDVAEGKHLETNIDLQKGDVILVP